VPLVLFLLLLGLVVWAIVRVSRQPQSPAPPPGPAPRPDPALEQARMRYARGEIDRDAYLRLVGDLGGDVAAPPPPAPPA